MDHPPRVVSFGECMLELQGQAFGTMRQTFGGDTLNTAIYLARCGAPFGLQVEYATALGDDGFSDELVRRWAGERVQTRLVRRLPGRLPGLYVIEVDARGARRFSYWRDRAAARDYFEVPAGATPLEAHAGEFDALYCSGISLAIIGEAGRARLLAVAEAMRRRGAQVVFDNNYRPRLWPQPGAAQQAFSSFTAIASIVLATLDDECALWGVHEAEALRRTLALPAPEVVVKRGPAPTLVREAGRALLAVPTEPVPAVVDTTAAGDSFAGAYLAARLAGQSAEASARAGNRLAARVVQHRGAVIPLEAMRDLVSPKGGAR